MSAAELLDPPPLRQGKADCVAFVGDNQTHGVVASVAGQFFEEPQVRDGGSREALQYLSEATAPRVLIVDIGDSGDPFSAMLSLTTAITSETRMIGIGTLNDIGFYRELTDAGVTDYLVKPVSEKALSAALTRAEDDLAPVREGTSETKRIAVIGARGGSGASTLAVNLSWVLAEERKTKTTLVDLDLEFGTVALTLDLEPTRGLREALENPTRIDGLFISSATAKLTDHLSVMACEETLTGEIGFAPGAVDILFDAIGRNSNCLVIDLPRVGYGLRHGVLRAITHVVLVTELSLPSLRDSIRLLGAIEDAAPGTPLLVVANRIGGGQQAMALADFQKALGRKVDLQIPDDAKAFNESANSGKPLVHSAPRSKAAQAVHKLADAIVAGQSGSRPGGAKALWQRLRNRS